MPLTLLPQPLTCQAGPTVVSLPQRCYELLLQGQLGLQRLANMGAEPGLTGKHLIS